MKRSTVDSSKLNQGTTLFALLRGREVQVRGGELRQVVPSQSAWTGPLQRTARHNSWRAGLRPENWRENTRAG